MKKSLLLTVLAASLIAIGLTGCKKDLGTPPTLEIAGFTYTPITENTDRNTVVPTTTITLTKNTEYPNYVTFIAEFSDPDLDADIVHVVCGNNDSKYYIGKQEYTSQISWWSKDYWTGTPGTANCRIYVTDKKGNKSNEIPLTLTFVNP